MYNAVQDQVYMPPTFLIAHLNRFTPNISVDLVSIVWHLQSDNPSKAIQIMGHFEFFWTKLNFPAKLCLGSASRNHSASFYISSGRSTKRLGNKIEIGSVQGKCEVHGGHSKESSEDVIAGKLVEQTTQRLQIKVKRRQWDKFLENYLLRGGIDDASDVVLGEIVHCLSQAPTVELSRSNF